MKHHHLISIWIVLCTIATSGMAIAEERSESAPDPESISARIEARFENIKTRLALTDAQVEQVIPIVREGFERQRAILKEYGIDLDRSEVKARERLSLQEARALRKELQAVREDTGERLEAVLTEEQMKAFKEMQEAYKEEVRARIRDRRN